MPHVIAWCGFLGAWLLVAGPLDQAVREIEDTGFEHEDLLAFLTIKDILNAWLYGAALIAVKETWELHESYEWPEWAFWLGVIGMAAFCISLTVGRTRRRHHRPAVEE